MKFEGHVDGENLFRDQEKYLNRVRTLGSGTSALILLAEIMVTIGADGIFDSSQLKELYMAFRKVSNTARGKSVGTEEHTVIANTSKLRSFYKVGEKFGTDGWSKMLEVARDIHVDILRSKDERKLLRSKAVLPTYEALVKVAATQMKKERDVNGVIHDVYPNLLTEEQIREVFIDQNKKEAKPSIEDVDVDWTNVDPASLPSDLQASYTKVRQLIEALDEARSAFECKFSNACNVAAGHKMIFSYRYGLACGVVEEENSTTRGKVAFSSLGKKGK